jgi:hypothetical protein
MAELKEKRISTAQAVEDVSLQPDERAISYLDGF